MLNLSPLLHTPNRQIPITFPSSLPNVSRTTNLILLEALLNVFLTVHHELTIY